MNKSKSSGSKYNENNSLKHTNKSKVMSKLFKNIHFYCHYKLDQSNLNYIKNIVTITTFI